MLRERKLRKSIKMEKKHKNKADQETYCHQEGIRRVAIIELERNFSSSNQHNAGNARDMLKKKIKDGKVAQITLLYFLKNIKTKGQENKKNVLQHI